MQRRSPIRPVNPSVLFCIMPKKEPIRLETNSKVAIIGGGPAGSFFALHLLRYAAERCITPEITIYQERDFEKLGPKGCKSCAGILSISLLRNLKELELTIPETIIQTKIDRYAVHSPYTSISISNPEREVRIISIFRGGGQRISRYESLISFDGWLLRQAQERGVRVENETVSHIHLGQEVQIEVGDRKLGYDLVVLATGVNAKPVSILGLDYVPPKTQTMAQDELYAGTAQVESCLGSAAHAFLIPHSGMIFGTLVPKGAFINVSVLSSGQPPVSVADFLSDNLVKNILPAHYERSCGCRPQAPVGSARNYFADGFVAIGDAVVSRLYKDGIGSSLLTARQAAHTAVCHGLSRQDFEHCYKPLCATISSDNWWGRLLFSLNNRTKNSRVFLLTQHRLIGDEQRNTIGWQPFTKAAWGMFTGSYSYTSIARIAFGPVSFIKLCAALFRESLASLFGKKAMRPKKLHVGVRKILILGSGFGGTYVLRRLVPDLNRNVNVDTTMVSDENFFLLSPLLHEVAIGSIETRHIAYPIRRLHWRDRFNFVQARVEKIDLGARKVITSRGVMDFDYLVLALGNVTNIPEFNPGGGQKSNIFTLKTLNDSMQIRNRIISVFEQANAEKDADIQKQLLTFVVSGAGYTGIQLVAELSDFVYKTLLRFYKTIDPENVRLILLEAEPEIVAELHPKLGAYALKCLERMRIELRLRAKVTHIWEDRVEINGREIVPTSTCIWVAGTIANPRIAELNVAKDSIGRVFVNEYMEVSDFPGVYAVGDCAHFEDLRSGQPIPPRAHTGVRQAKIAAHNILADIRGKDKKPYLYATPPELVSLGASKAMFRFHGLRLYGFAARLIWIGAYSLLVTGMYNRIRIVMDWLLSLVFDRDTTFIKLKR